MKNKNEFKSSQAYIRILILCFGVFFSSSSFAYDCYDDYAHYSGIDVICQAGFSKSFTWQPGSDYLLCTINGSTGCTEAGVSDTSQTCSDGSESFTHDCPISCDAPLILNPELDGCISPPSPTCPAGQHLNILTNQCEADVVYVTCWDGSQALNQETCPSRPTEQCWDNSIIFPDESSCSVIPPSTEIGTQELCISADYFWDNSSCVSACPSGKLAGSDHICFDKPPFYPDCVGGTFPDGRCKPVDLPVDHLSCPTGYTPVFEPYSGKNMCRNDADFSLIEVAPSFCTKDGSYDCYYSEVDKNCQDIELHRLQCKANDSYCGVNGLYRLEGQCKDNGTDNGWVGFEVPTTAPVEITPDVLKDCGNGVLIPSEKTCPVKETPVKPTPDEPTTTDPYQPPSGGDGDGTGGDGGDNSTPTGGTGDTTKPTSSPVGIETPPNAPVEIDNPNIDPCLNGGCPSDSTDPTAATDYARQSTLQANVQVNQAIGKLIQDIRFNELASMKKFTQDSSNSLDVIEQYQALNQDKMQAIKNELGLQRIDDVAFYKLATKGVDQSNTELKNIYNLIDWSQNKLIESAHDRTKLLSEIKNTSDTDLKIQQEQLKELQKISDANNSASNNSDELLAETKEIKSTLDTAFKDDGSPINLPSTEVDLGNDEFDFSRLDNMRDDIQNITSDNMSKLMDTHELTHFEVLLDAVIPGVSSLYSTLPSTSCTQEFTQPFTIQGTTRIFSLDVCGRLADLKLALAWIFGWYAMRTAFNNIFAPKGS